MRIGIFSTFGVKCGIASYSRQLAEELVRQGHVVTILANYPCGQEHDVDFGEPVGYTVKRTWEWYGRTNKVQEDFVDFSQFDIIHIQYESFLWHQSYFKQLWKSGIPFVVTYHSSCIAPGFILNGKSNSIAHNRRLVLHIDGGDKCHYLPMPVLTNSNRKPFEEKEPRLVSFGLHRNNDDFCHKAILHLKKQTGKKLEYITSYGDAKWKSDEELNEFLNNSRYIALMYPPVDASVSSSAVCRALGQGSVVFTSSTKWFDHVKPYVHQMDTPEELGDVISMYGAEGEVGDLLRADLVSRSSKAIEEMGIEKVVKEHIEIYKKEIARYEVGH